MARTSSSGNASAACSFSRAAGALAGGDDRGVLLEIGAAVAAPVKVHLERGADLGIQLAAQVIGEKIRAGTAGEFLHQLRSPQPRDEQGPERLPGAMQSQLDGVRANPKLFGDLLRAYPFDVAKQQDGSVVLR